MLYRHSYPVKLAKKFRKDGCPDPVGAAVIMGEVWYRSKHGKEVAELDSFEMLMKFSYLDTIFTDSFTYLEQSGYIEVCPSQVGNERMKFFVRVTEQAIEELEV